MDGPVLDLADRSPSKNTETAFEDVTAAEPVKGAPVAQLQVGPTPPKSEASEGRPQVEYAAWRQLQLNAAQVTPRLILCLSRMSRDTLVADCESIATVHAMSHSIPCGRENAGGSFEMLKRFICR